MSVWRRLMVSYEIALVTSGCIGSFVAVVHGALMQKLMIPPILANTSHSQTSRRLIPLLLHFSTFCWLLGGMALIATPFLTNSSIILTISTFVGVLYTFGTIGNLWGTKGRHPGWMLLAIAVGLIIYAVLQIVTQGAIA